MGQFFNSFVVVGFSILKIFLLSAAGFFLFKKKHITEESLRSMSSLTINLTLPALIFSNFMNNFNVGEISFWYLFPLGGIILNLIGIAGGYFLTGFLSGYKRRHFGALLGLHNSGYLPLALSASLLSGTQQKMAFNYIFLIIMGTGLVMWTAGVNLLAEGKSDKKEYLKNIFSPPFVTILVSIILGFSGLNRYVPELVIKTTELAGNITIPLIMVVLGGILANLNLREDVDIKGISLLILLKLIVLPAAGIFMIYLLNVPELLAFIILIQLGAPPATNLVVIGSHYGERTDFLNQSLFYSYLISIVTLSFLIAFFQSLY